MTIALVTIAAIYLVIASLTALNSALEAGRPGLAGKDIAVIALVSTAWPIIACALLTALAGRRLFSRKREFLPVTR